MVNIVIGANYGDEGKGIVTSMLASMINKKSTDKEKYVILPHGGMQRGHTAYLGNDKWMNYHSYCSASHLGWYTAYGENFIFNLPIFYKEKSFDYPKAYVHEKCKYTTLFDMMLNCITEEYEHHGSVGVGVWETLQRYKNGVGFSIFDFYYSGSGTRCSQFFKIADYVSDEIEKRGYSIKNTEWKDIFEGYHKSFDYESLHFALKYTETYNKYNFMFNHPVIFECSQGLMLDENYSGDSIYSTPSHTGVHEPIFILNEAHVSRSEPINVYYVTRSYLTRHGNGELPNECSPEKIGNITPDRFNVENKYQGKFRYASFDEKEVYEMNKRIYLDFSSIKRVYPNSVCNLVITHTDEVSPDIITDNSKIFDNIIKISLDDILTDNTKKFA